MKLVPLELLPKKNHCLPQSKRSLYHSKRQKLTPNGLNGRDEYYSRWYLRLLGHYYDMLYFYLFIYFLLLYATEYPWFALAAYMISRLACYKFSLIELPISFNYKMVCIYAMCPDGTSLSFSHKEIWSWITNLTFCETWSIFKDNRLANLQEQENWKISLKWNLTSLRSIQCFASMVRQYFSWLCYWP